MKYGAPMENVHEFPLGKQFKVIPFYEEGYEKKDCVFPLRSISRQILRASVSKYYVNTESFSQYVHYQIFYVNQMSDTE